MRPALAFFLLTMPSSAAPVAVSSAAAAVESPLLPRCRAGTLDVDALVLDRAGLSAAEAVPLLELPGYLACRGLASARPSCPALDGLSGGLSDAAGSCRDLEWEAKFLHAILRGGDAAALCRGRFAGRPPAAANALCASIIKAASSRSPGEVCAAYLSAGVGSEKDAEGCRKRMSYLTGKAESCGVLGDSAQRERCGQMAALTAGLRDAKACAASPLCGVLEKGDGAACAPLKAALAKRICAQAESAAGRAEGQRLEDGKKLKAETEEALRRKAAKEKEAKAAARRKPQFEKGQAMKTTGSVVEIMKKVGRGEKIEAAKHKGEVEKTGGADENQDRK